jgi:two-component system, OmpR family, response regulator
MQEGNEARRGEKTFRWHSSAELPPEFDLRPHGWKLVGSDERCTGTILLVETGRLDPLAWLEFLAEHPLPDRHTMIAVGVANGSERATLIHIGFGDVIAPGATSAEFVARCSRIAAARQWLPRKRRFLGIELDLLAREALADGVTLGLNPREFALLWRLADTPDQPVSKEDIIHDVWRMGFVPETNSIAVHMSRLRRKLSLVGLGHIIETVTGGGYSLRTAPAFDEEQITGGFHSHRPRESRTAGTVSWMAA